MLDLLTFNSYILPMKENKKYQDILITAIDLFKRYGMKRVSIEEICQKGKVSKVTFYKHFKNKNELIKLIFKTWFDEAYEEMEKIDSEKIPFPQKLKRIFHIKEKIIENMSPEFINEYQNLSPDILTFFEQEKQYSYEKFLHYLKKWQQEGHIRKNIKPEFIIAAMQSLDYFIKIEPLPKLYDQYIHYVEEIFNFFFYGILTERLQDED